MTFASRVRGQVGSECQIHSTSSPAVAVAGVVLHQAGGGTSRPLLRLALLLHVGA